MKKEEKDDLSKFCIDTARTYRYVTNHILEMQAEIYYLRHKLNTVSKLIKLTPKADQYSVKYVRYSRKRYDKIIEILEGDNNEI